MFGLGLGFVRAKYVKGSKERLLDFTHARTHARTHIRIMHFLLFYLIQCHESENVWILMRNHPSVPAHAGLKIRIRTVLHKEVCLAVRSEKKRKKEWMNEKEEEQEEGQEEENRRCASVELMYLVFTRMPGESYRKRFRCFLCLCDVFRALINSLSCWE